MKKFISYLQRWYCMLICLSLVAGGCCGVVWRSLLRKSSREKTNAALQLRAKKILKKMRVNYRIEYAKNFHFIDDSPKIFMSNHLSLFDTPLFYATINETIRIVTKKELTRVPLLGRAILDAEHVVIDRKKSATEQPFYQDAKNKLQSGISLWIFPEGTRSKTGELLPFKKGSFYFAKDIGAQIIPVALIGTDRILPAKKALPRFNQDVVIRLGEPIDASKFSDVLQLVEKAREKILLLTKKTSIPR